MPQDVLWVGTGALIEQPDSPTFTRDANGDSGVERFKGGFELALASAPPKGTQATGRFTGLLVDSSVVTRERGGIGTLTIVYKGFLEIENPGDIQVPPDEYDTDFAQQEFALEKHPAFSSLDEDDVRAAKNYAEAESDSELADVGWIFLGTNEPLKELARRFNNGVTHFKYDLPIVRWTSYYATEPAADGGGYFEFPGSPAGVPSGYDWIRLPDGLGQANNGFWRITRSWQAVINPDTYLYPV